MTPTLKKGDVCVACPGGSWGRMKVLRCNDDGTFKLLPEGSDDFLDEWEGVTRDEISFDDEALWPAIFDAIRGAKAGIGIAEVVAAVRRVGIQVDDAAMGEFWSARCGQLFGATDCETLLLDRDQAYRFFLSASLSAKRLSDPESDPSRDLFKLYWNGVRMGGRSPADVGRSIGLADTFAAFGLTDTPDDVERVAALARFEVNHELTLPPPLEALWSKENVEATLLNGHCNNPEPQPVGDWKLLRRASDGDAWGAAFAVRIMLPHQGSHAWWAVFDEGADDAEVWISFEDDGPPVRRVARSVPFFFWDLRQTSRCWEQRDAGGPDLS
jgi:hypothetical protein